MALAYCGLNCIECDELPCSKLKKYLGSVLDSMDNLKHLAIGYRKTV